MNAPTTIKAEFFQWPETVKLLAAFTHAGIDARFVGGCVRDTLLGVKVKDVDFCTPALPEKMIQVLKQTGITAIPTGIAHGTITAKINDKHFEITTLRRDVACDGRHAEVAYTHDYQEDAARRDFTINALSADSSGKIYDYFKGLDDLESKRLRFIGKAEERITEDALRILRLFRFQAQLGFVIDAEALQAANQLKDKLGIISAERIKSEIFKLLASANPLEALKQIRESGVWQQCFNTPLGTDIGPLLQAEKSLQQQVDPLVRFTWLVSQTKPQNAKQTAAALQEKLKLSNEETRKIATCLAHLDEVTPTLNEAGQRKLQRQLGTEDYVNLLTLAAARDNQAAPYQPMFKQALSWQIPVFPVTGNDLLALGFTSGAALGETLKRLETLWEASGYQMERESLLKQARNKHVD